MLPSVAVVGIVAVDNGELIIVWLVVIIPGNEESALGGALRSNGAPGVGVSRSDEDEEARREHICVQGIRARFGVMAEITVEPSVAIRSPSWTRRIRHDGGSPMP
jgi:hypothetical protein